MRKAVAHAPVYLNISQTSEGDNTKYKIDQSTTANIPAVNEMWITDWEFREIKDPVMGKVRSKARWIEPGSVEDSDFLASEWLDEGKEQVEAYVESVESSWIAHQVRSNSKKCSSFRLINTTRFGASKTLLAKGCS